MNEDTQKQLIELGSFKDNNGAVMRIFNMSAFKYYKLKELSYALPQISKNELLKCLSYLSGEGYLLVRNILTKASSEISDAPFDELEAKLSPKGMKLLEFAVHDQLVEL